MNDEQQQKKHTNNIDALEAMSQGKQAAPQQQKDTGDSGGGTRAPVDLNGGGQDATTPSEPADKPQPGTAPADTGKAAARTRTPQRRPAPAVHAHHFKQFMIPMLLIVGVMLVGMGATLGLILINRSDTVGPPTMIDQPWVPWAVVASFPLGAIMFVGAWMFHREGKNARAKKQKQQTEQQEQ